MSALNQDRFELHTAIRANAVFRPIPVIILASSTHDADVSRGYELGANSYLTKPARFRGPDWGSWAVWFRRAELPPRSRK